ncbi:MAG: DUF2007 domain-containing protein [Myxococcota bacterium]
MASLVEVFRSPHTAEAQLKAAVLKDRGIHAVVMSPDLAATVGVGSHIVPARVMVPDDQAASARETLQALDAMSEQEGPTGPEKCPECGAKWEPGFGVCWQCGYELETAE